MKREAPSKSDKGAKLRLTHPVIMTLHHCILPASSFTEHLSSPFTRGENRKNWTSLIPQDSIPMRGFIRDSLREQVTKKTPKNMQIWVLVPRARNSQEQALSTLLPLPPPSTSRQEARAPSVRSQFSAKPSAFFPQSQNVPFKAWFSQI